MRSEEGVEFNRTKLRKYQVRRMASLNGNILKSYPLCNCMGAVHKNYCSRQMLSAIIENAQKQTTICYSPNIKQFDSETGSCSVKLHFCVHFTTVSRHLLRADDTQKDRGDFIERRPRPVPRPACSEWIRVQVRRSGGGNGATVSS